MAATSSTCSLMNHCMNCSAAKSFSSRAVRVSSWIWVVTRFSWSRASATGATMSPKRLCGASLPGMVTSRSVSMRKRTIIIAWSRSSMACW